LIEQLIKIIHCRGFQLRICFSKHIFFDITEESHHIMICTKL